MKLEVLVKVAFEVKLEVLVRGPRTEVEVLVTITLQMKVEVLFMVTLEQKVEVLVMMIPAESEGPG